MDETDYYNPVFSRTVEKFKKYKCNCGSSTSLEFGKHGSTKLVCEDCDLTKHGCPFCGKIYKKQQTVVSHCGNHHSDVRKCPVCSSQLPVAISDRIEHMSCHISRGMYSSLSTFDPTTVNSFNMNSFPNQNQSSGNSNVPLDVEQVRFENSEFGSYHGEDYGGDEIESPTYSFDGTQLSETEIFENVDGVSDEEDGEEDGEIYHYEEELESDYISVVDKRKDDHLNSLFSEFCFFDDNLESYEVVIEPVMEKEADDYGIFFDQPNLNLAKFSRKAHLSGPLLQELIDDMGTVYESGVDFFSAETLTEKVHLLSKEEGFGYKKLKCPNGHLVCVIPIEEGLKMMLSNSEFLMEFHVKEWEIGEDDPYMHFRQGEKFIKESKRARDGRCHVISIVANQDDFPVYLTTVYPVKGYYYSCGNLDFPSCERHVVCYAFGLQCDGCRETVEDSFVENVNRLSVKPFLFRHKMINKYVRSILNYSAEVDDSPEVAKRTMSKSHNGRLFCSQCGQHENLRIDPHSYHFCKAKTLIETESLYHQCKVIVDNSTYNDGSLTRVSKIEDRTGRTFTTSVYDKDRGHNVTVLKKPTSLFKLEEYTKRNLILPNGPFHAIVKGYILHVKDALSGNLTEPQRREIQEKWIKLEFPKGTKKPKNLWGIGGSNFDAILSLLYGLPTVIHGVAPIHLSLALETNFDSIVKILTPGFSRNQLREAKRKFTNTIYVVANYLDINYPVTHQVFHIWDRCVSPDNFLTESSSSPNLPPPPKGPILINEGDEAVKIVSLGPAKCWNEKKFEVMHRRFKKMMRKCFLRNPCVFLIKGYVADETIAILYPERKWSRYNSLIRYTVLQSFELGAGEKRDLMNHLGIGAWEVRDVDFLGIKELGVRTKTFRRKYKIVISGDCGNIHNMVLVKWNGGNGWEFSSLLIVLELFGSKTWKIHKVEDVQGKPIMSGRRLVNVIM